MIWMATVSRMTIWMMIWNKSKRPEDRVPIGHPVFKICKIFWDLLYRREKPWYTIMYFGI